MSAVAMVARPPHDAEEFRALLEVRAASFRRSWMERYCAFYADGLELDPYDVQAHHLGLFAEGGPGGKDEPVGYVRAVGTSPVPETVALLEELDLLDRVQLRPDPIDRLPAFSDFFAEGPSSYEAYDPLFEVSRIAIRPELQGRRWTKFLIDAAAAWALSLGNEAFVCRVTTQTEGVYRAVLGAERIDGSGEVEHCGHAVCFLGIHERTLPERSAPKVFALRDQLASEGLMTRRPHGRTTVVVPATPFMAARV
ncbi:MAG: hypothetical protein AAGH15_01210 [Myxococcota bacterium]